MSTRIFCDVCGRQTDSGAVTVQITATTYGRSQTLHLCHPRDGDDVGCFGHFAITGLEAAQAAARAWLEEHRPYQLS